MEKENLVWSLFVELRKELVESQKLRAQVVGFKITFVSAAIGLISTNLDKIPNILFLLPAFASIFFDFLINSYSFSIKRIGLYIREYIEPEIKSSYTFTNDFLLWQEFLKNPKTIQKLSFWGNFGITFIASGVAIVMLFSPFKGISSLVLLCLIIIFLIIDIFSFRLGSALSKKDFRISNTSLRQ